MKKTRPFSQWLTLLALAISVACSGGAPPAPTVPSASPSRSILPLGERTLAAPSPTASPTSLPSATQVPTLPTPPVHTGEGPLYEVVFSIPVGPGGVEYHGLDVMEIETTGPNALAILGDGSFVVSDSERNRLLIYSSKGQRTATLDLSVHGILYPSGTWAAGDRILLLETSYFMRAYWLSQTGELLSSYDLPESFLPGLQILPGCDGEIILKYPEDLYQLVNADGQEDFHLLPEGLRCGGQSFRALGSTAWLGHALLQTSLTTGMGGLALLQARPDGSVYLTRDDVIETQVIRVDRTVHLIDRYGHQLGVAREPLAEQLFYVPAGLTVGPDGQVYDLIPRRQELDIVRLNFYLAMQPLRPQAKPPSLTTVQDVP